MLKSLIYSIYICSVFVISVGAQAAVLSPAGVATAKAQYNMIDRFAHFEFTQDTQEALNNLVKSGVMALAEKGLSEPANEFWHQWKTNYSHLHLRNAQQVGDHKPLYDWLNTYYGFLEKNLGKERCQKLHLDDIPIMNFTVPVALQPGGDMRSGQRWPRDEYRRHFVPFASITTYWVSYGLCRSHTSGAASLICERVAMVFKQGMHDHAAPSLSDFIFDRWGKAKNQMALPVDFGFLSNYYANALTKIVR